MARRGRDPNRQARRVELGYNSRPPNPGATTGGAQTSPARFDTASSWTSGTSPLGQTGYYYDLVHSRGRSIVAVQLYDAKVNTYRGWMEAHPLTGSETTTLRIWLNWDPGANNIKIMYM